MIDIEYYSIGFIISVIISVEGNIILQIESIIMYIGNDTEVLFRILVGHMQDHAGCILLLEE